MRNDPDHDGLPPGLPPPGLAEQLAPRGPTTACPEPMAMATYLDGRATPGEVEAIEMHLADCAACFDAVRVLRALLAEEDMAAVPEHVREAARSLVAASRRRTASASRRGRRIWPVVGRWGLAAAASIAVCTVGYRTGLAAFGASAIVSDELVAEVSFGVIDPAEMDAADLTLLGMANGEGER